MFRVMLYIENATVKTIENFLKTMLNSAPDLKNISPFGSHNFPQEHQQIFSPKQLHCLNTNCTEEDFTSTQMHIQLKDLTNIRI